MFSSDDRVDEKVSSQSIQDALIDAKPSFTEAFAGGVRKEVLDIPMSVMNSIDLYRGTQTYYPARDAVNELDEAMSQPNVGFFRKAAYGAGQFTGYFNPLNWIIGGAAVKAARVVGGAVAQFIPESIALIGRISSIGLLGEKTVASLPKFVPKTVGEVGANLAQGFVVGAATGAPAALNENYNELTGEFDMVGAIDQTLAMGGVGMLLDSVGMAAGAIYGKIRAGKSFSMPKMGEGTAKNVAEIDAALKQGKISEEYHDWAKTYLTDPDNIEKLKGQASSVLASEDYKVDSVTGKVHLELMGKEGFDNLHSAIIDQLGSNVSDDLKTAFSDYHYANMMDNVVDKYSHMIDGLQGAVKFLDHRLDQKAKNMSLFAKIRKSEKYENMKVSHPLSERSLFNRIKANRYDIAGIPNSLTKVLKKRIAQEKKLSELSREVEKYKRQVAAGKDISDEMMEKAEKSMASIQEIKGNISKLRSPKVELDHLEDYFLSKDKLPDNLKMTEEYNRLQDLAEFSPKARSLLHHVDAIDRYDVQGANNDIIKAINGIIKSNVKKYADPEKLMSYLKARLDSDISTDSKLPRELSGEQAVETMRDQNKNIDELMSDDKSSIEDAERDVIKAKSKEVNKEFDKNVKQFSNAKETSAAREILISCALSEE